MVSWTIHGLETHAVFYIYITKAHQEVWIREESLLRHPLLMSREVFLSSLQTDIVPMTRTQNEAGRFGCCKSNISEFRSPYINGKVPITIDFLVFSIDLRPQVEQILTSIEYEDVDRALSYRICEGRVECFVWLALSKDIFVLLRSHCCPNRQRPIELLLCSLENVCVYPEKASTTHLHLMSSQTFFDGTEHRKKKETRWKE